MRTDSDRRFTVNVRRAGKPTAVRLEQAVVGATHEAVIPLTGQVDESWIAAFHDELLKLSNYLGLRPGLAQSWLGTVRVSPSEVRSFIFGGSDGLSQQLDAVETAISRTNSRVEEARDNERSLMKQARERGNQLETQLNRTLRDWSNEHPLKS